MPSNLSLNTDAPSARLRRRGGSPVTLGSFAAAGRCKQSYEWLGGAVRDI
jgi:hypothetical protein